MPQVKFAYLFGSYATARARVESDVDIAVYISQEYDLFDARLEIHHKLQKALKKEVDLVILNNAKNFDLLEDIFREGKVVKESADDARLMFELYKEHEIKDYKIFKKMLHVA